VIFAWDALTATRQRWRHLTGDRFRVEILGFWQAACDCALGCLREGVQRSIRQQLLVHMEGVADDLRQGKIEAATSRLLAFTLRSGSGKFRRRAASKAVALGWSPRRIAPLTAIPDGCLAVKRVLISALKQIVESPRLPAGRQRAILIQLDLHLTLA
jgi:hypothetical protein